VTPPVDRRVQLTCVMCEWITGALYGVGLVLVARLFLPVPDPSAPAAHIVALYAEHRDRIRLGALLMVIGCGFFAPFGAVLIARTRRMESDTPVFTYLQLVSFGATLAVTFLVPMSFALAAFRPEQDPNITQMFNDSAWFLLLYIWPLFTVWLWSVGVPILLAPRGVATFPRWVGHLSLWCGLFFAPSFLIDHVKTGPLAYNGLFGVYVPAAALGFWCTATAFAVITSLRNEASYRGREN
jgi:hypothetical protein